MCTYLSLYFQMCIIKNIKRVFPGLFLPLMKPICNKYNNSNQFPVTPKDFQMLYFEEQAFTNSTEIANLNRWRTFLTFDLL